MRSGPGPETGLPASEMTPSTGCKKPPTAFSRLDFPQPEGPSMMNRSASSAAKSTRQVAVTTCRAVLYCSVTARASSSGAATLALASRLMIDPRKEQPLPVLRRLLDHADLDHKSCVFHRLLRRRSPADLRILDHFDELRLGQLRMRVCNIDVGGTGRVILDE